MGKKLYHYCNLDTLMAILSSKSLRLSDLSKTNDFMERKWVLNIIEEALVEFFNEEKIKIKLKENFYYWEGIYSHMEYIFSQLNMYVEQSSFITCFSQNGDLLSQWRAYACDGTGVAIGFNSKLLNNIDKRNSEVSIEHVLYDKDKQIDEVKFAAGCALEYFKRFFNYNEDIILPEFNELFIEEIEVFGEVFSEIIAKSSCFIKNPAFKEEDEVRIFYAPFLYIATDDENSYPRELLNKTMRFNNFILNPIDFYIRNNRVVGYCDLSFSKLIDKGIISEIIIGPSSKITKEDVIIILEKYGYNSLEISIEKSTATYQIK